VSFEHPSALRAVAGRHGDDKRVPQHRARYGKARAHVAARHLDDWCAGLQASVRFGGEQDGASGPVLHASARLQKFGLSQ
jgi:hypothetical protein